MATCSNVVGKDNIVATAEKINRRDFDVKLELTADEAAALHHLLYRGVSTGKGEVWEALSRVMYVLQPVVQGESYSLSKRNRFTVIAKSEPRE